MRGRKGTDRKGGGKKKKKKRRRQCDHRGRDWNDVATHPGMQTTIRSGRGKEAFSLRASGEGLAHWHPDFGLLASRLSVALSHPVYSTLLQQLQETNTPESSVSSGPSFSHSRPWDPEQSWFFASLLWCFGLILPLGDAWICGTGSTWEFVVV